MHFTLIQYAFMLTAAAAGGFTFMAGRDLFHQPDRGLTSHAKPLAWTAGITTLVFAVIFAVSL